MVLTVALMMSATAFAQNENNPERRQMNKTEMVKNRTDRFAKRYALNDDQVKKLLKLNEQYADKIMFNRGNRRGFNRQEMTDEMRKQMQERFAEMRKAQKAYDAELKQILTEEQYTNYQNDRTKMMQNRGQRHGNPQQHQN